MRTIKLTIAATETQLPVKRTALQTYQRHTLCGVSGIGMGCAKRAVQAVSAVHRGREGGGEVIAILAKEAQKEQRGAEG
jgi:hypothetical protein